MLQQRMRLQGYLPHSARCSAVVLHSSPKLASSTCPCLGSRVPQFTDFNKIRQHQLGCRIVRQLRCRADGSQLGSQPNAFADSPKSFLQGPVPEYPPDRPFTHDEVLSERMGERTYLQQERLLRDERQKLWDNMKAIARVRYEHGLMPEWFKPEWLEMKEPPVNEFMRVDIGSKVYWENHKESNGGDGGGNKPPSDGSGGGWWREDDPYWFMRDTGAHAMRWWTLGFGIVLAGSGMLQYAWHNNEEALRNGCATGAVLACCAMAMSNMETGEGGALAVKVAFGVCAWLALRELWQSWHVKGRAELGWAGACGALLAVLYCMTDMSGLDDMQIPRLQDITAKLRVPDADPALEQGYPVWISAMGAKLRAYMQYRRNKIQETLRTPKIMIKPETFNTRPPELMSAMAPRGPPPALGAAAAAPPMA